MKVRQLKNVMCVEETQRVRIIDAIAKKKVETVAGWELDEDRETHERFMNLTVCGVSFNADWLIVWAN